MLVSTVSGSTPQASASSRACAWSSASRSTWWSSACSPAAARTPTWRIPPPIRLRRTRASAIASREPTTSEPDRGAQPLGQADRHHVDAGAVRRERDAGGDVRVPDARAVEVDADADRVGPGRAAPARSVERQHRAAGEVVGVLDRDRGGADEERAPCRVRTSSWIAARSTCPRGSRQVRIVSPVNAPWAPSSARAMWAEASHSTSCPAATSDATASTLAIDPVGVNSASSWPNSSGDPLAAARATVGSSP